MDLSARLIKPTHKRYEVLTFAGDIGRSCARRPKIEPVSCEFELSLSPENTDIENSRSETGALNLANVIGNREKCVIETRRRLDNSRECRANFCERDMSHRDWTGWLGM